MDHLDFSCHCLIQMYVCFLSTSKVNLCFSNENAMIDFVKLGMSFMKFVWALGIYKYFKAFPVALKKICHTVSKCFHVSTALTKSFAYYQLHRNKSKFLDYIFAVIFEKRNKLNCGDLTISCLLEYNSLSLIGHSVCMWCLKLCISFV